MPSFECSRPALELLDRLPAGTVGLTFARIRQIADRPRTTVVRHLDQLTDAHLIARLRRDLYATPQDPTQRLLMIEPSAYHRSLLLFDHIIRDVVGALKTSPFACLPVRSILDVEIPQAVPVFKLGHDITSRGSKLLTDHALHFNYDDETVVEEPVRFPSDAPVSEPRRIPVLPVETCLALFAATADPRFVHAVRRAAGQLDLPVDPILHRARSLYPETPPVKTLRDNTIVFPDWLAEIAEAAETMHGRRAILDHPRSGADDDG